MKRYRSKTGTGLEIEAAKVPVRATYVVRYPNGSTDTVSEDTLNRNFEEIEPVLENQTQLTPEEQHSVETFGATAAADKAWRSHLCDLAHHPEEAPATGLDATLNERGARYGDYAGQSDITQSLKDAFRACETGWEKLTASQRETLDMVASKIARILNGDPNYVDSWHDIAGYTTLIENQLTGKPR